MKENSIIFKTLTYLVLFSFAILFILWFFQIAFLSYFYEKYQVAKMDNLANSISNKFNYEELEDLSIDNSVCIQYLTTDTSLTYNPMYKGCLLSSLSDGTINSYKSTMIKSNEKIYKLKLVNPKYNTKSILYGVRIDKNNYVFINTTLENLDSTSKVLQSQLIYIVIIVMTLSLVVAYFISKKVTKPIVEINKKARDMSSGQFNISFDKSGIYEIDELADTLNKTNIELRKTDQLRRDLMANVSHDLKTPLTMIKAYAEKIRDISYRNKQSREDDLSIIIAETDRLNILVNDILVLSKMQSMTDELEITQFDLSECIRNILRRYLIIKETLDYKFEVNIPEHCMIKADEKRLSQVIYNLINNAINYTGDDNKVIISVIENTDTYFVSIKDTGKGISNEDLPHIWDRYYKNNKNHQRNVVGTGLGLSICKQILKQHKYSYGVNTKKNHGSEFYFVINK